MTKKYTLETLPVPDDSRVQLRRIHARKVAVLSYSGSWSESRYLEKLEIFKPDLKNESIQTFGEPILARYNSPFLVWFLRRNEIWLEVGE